MGVYLLDLPAKGFTKFDFFLKFMFQLFLLHDQTFIGNHVIISMTNLIVLNDYSQYSDYNNYFNKQTCANVTKLLSSVYN